MPTVGAGILGLNAYLLQKLLEASATWAALTASAGGVWIAEADDTDADEIALPRAIINVDGTGRARIGTATWGYSSPDMFLTIQLEPTDDTQSIHDQQLQVLNTVGAILREMEVLSGTGSIAATSTTHLNMVAWEFQGGPIRCNPTHEGGAVYYEVGVVIKVL